MGLLQMSLINQMLQDLDARHADHGGPGLVPAQVKAVAEQRRIHPVWWLVPGMAIFVGALIAWLYVRQAAPVSIAPPVVQPILALKLASGLSATPPAPSDPRTDAGAAVTEAGAPFSVEVKTPVDVASNDPPRIAQQAKATDTSVSGAIAVPAKKSPAVTVLPIAPAASAPTLSNSGAPTQINKQVKEPSLQQRAESEYRRATLWQQQGRATEAMTLLEQVLQLDPQHTAARQTLVGLLLENKRQDEAVRRLHEGLSLDANQPGLAMILARQQVELGELHPAVETLRRSLPFAADRADYQAFLAALLQREERHPEAVEHYLSALRIAPQKGVWWMGLGISLQAQKRIPEARDAFNHAKASNVLSPELLAFVEQKLNQLPR